MSIVIAVANMSRVVVKSDGLLRDLSTGEMIASDHEKMVNLNDNCIIGYTGILKNCEMVLNEYKKLATESGVDISTLKPTTVIYDLCELSKVIVGTSSPISFLVAGRENNNIILIGFTSDDGYVINNFSPDDNEHIKYITFGSDVQKNAVQYPKYYQVNHSLESSMNDYIRFISKLDDSVNDHIFTRKLCL